MALKSDPFPIFINIKQAAGVIGISTNVFRQWIKRGNCPPVYKLAKHLHRIRKDELLSWLESKKRTPNAQHNNRAQGKPVRLDVAI